MLIDKIISKIKNSNKVLLMIHENPDGDTLAASSAFYQVLKKINKNVSMICKDEVPKPLEFLPLIDKVKKDILFGDFDSIIVIDCGDLKRTGFADRLKNFTKKRGTLINIDHHPKNDLWKIAKINLVNQNKSSASEIIWEIFERMQIPWDKNIATALLTGIYTDTGGFKHSNTSPETLKIAAELLKIGARLNKITTNISLNKSISAMKLWGIALSRIYRNQKLGIVSSVITLEDLKKCQASHSDISGVVNLINSIPNIKAAILFYETEDGQIKTSIRTEDEKVDISKLANIFGGGGHKKAAGFSIPGKLKLNKNSWEIVLE